MLLPIRTTHTILVHQVIPRYVTGVMDLLMEECCCSVATPAASAASIASAEVQAPSSTEAPAVTQASPGKDYPAHTVVDFPALSPTMERGSIGTWVKKEGDYVSSGTHLPVYKGMECALFVQEKPSAPL